MEQSSIAIASLARVCVLSVANFAVVLIACLRELRKNKLRPDFLKDIRLPNQIGLSPSFFTDIDKVLTSDLTKLLGSIWTREEVVCELCKSVIVPIY